jgi:hypothetical protein
MAKYTRFDPRNKKRNKHKDRVKDALNTKRIHYVGKEKEYDESEDFYSSAELAKLRRS